MIDSNLLSGKQLKYIGFLFVFLSSVLHADTRWQKPLLGYVEFKPLTYQNAQGRAVGSIIESTKNSFEDISLSADYRKVPPARLFNELEQGLIDGWFGIEVPQLAPLVLFSERPVASITLNIYRLKEEEELSLEMMSGEKSIILIHGWTYGGLRQTLEKKHTTYDAPNNLSAFKMLELGRASYLLSYEEVVAKTDVSLEGLASTPIETIRIYFQLRKDFPESEAIMHAFNQVNLGQH